MKINRKFSDNYSRCQIHIHNETKERLTLLSQTTKKSYSKTIEELIEQKYTEVFYNDNCNGRQLL